MRKIVNSHSRRGGGGVDRDSTNKGYCMYYRSDTYASLFFPQNIPYPSVRPQPDGSQEIKLPEGPYGVPDVMLNG